MAIVRATKLLERPKVAVVSVTPTIAIVVAGFLPKLSARKPPKTMESMPPLARSESKRLTSSILRNELRYSERKLYHNVMENAYKELEIAIIAVSLPKAFKYPLFIKQSAP
jgi:hypothetical protein